MAAETLAQSRNRFRSIIARPINLAALARAVPPWIRFQDKVEMRPYEQRSFPFFYFSGDNPPATEFLAEWYNSAADRDLEVRKRTLDIPELLFFPTVPLYNPTMESGEEGIIRITTTSTHPLTLYGRLIIRGDDQTVSVDLDI